MKTEHISGYSAQAGSSIKAKQNVEKKTEGGKKSVDDVLASLREMMPGWTISTSTTDWGEGFRNIQIDRDILQRMADDPKEMEKYKSMILELEDTVPALEKWAQENPGQTLLFELSLNADGKVTSMSIVNTLLGVEKRTTFDLQDDAPSWAELIRQKLDALSHGQVEDANGSKSWIT